MTQIFFLRHAKADLGDSDLTRDLDEVGRDQVKARWKQLEGTTFDLVVSSIAPRAFSTAGKVGDVDYNKIQALPEMYWDIESDIGRAIDIMFETLKYAPLSEYLKHKLGSLVRVHAEGAWSAFEKIAKTSHAINILIVGHAVLLPAMAIVPMAVSTDGVFIEKIKNLALGEAGGFVVTGK